MERYTVIKVRVIDNEFQEDWSCPTLLDWAGIEIGDVFEAHKYDDGQIWAQTQKAVDGVEVGEWFMFKPEEIEEIE